MKMWVCAILKRETLDKNGQERRKNAQAVLRERYSSPHNRLRRPGFGVEVYLYSFFNLGVRWGGWSTPLPDHFTPWKDPVPIV